MEKLTNAEMLALDFLSNGVIKFAKRKDPFLQSNGYYAPFYVYDQEIPSKSLELRNILVVKMMTLLTERYSDLLESKKLTLAAASTGSCPWASFIAQSLNVPLVIVRQKMKSYGLHNTIEGHVPADHSVVLIDDVVFTGNNSLKTIAQLQKDNASVLGTIAIMDLQVPEATVAYKKQNLKLHSLFTFKDMMNMVDLAIEVANDPNAEANLGLPAQTIEKLASCNLASAELLDLLNEWHQAPNSWSKELIEE